MIIDPENPGSWLKLFRLNSPVISCESAAKAKGIHLEHELKSLLLVCDHGHAVAHVRGSERLSLRAVKSSLALQQANLAGPADLHALEVSPGTIHPFAPPIWPLPHLVTRAVLALPWVTTNAGTLNAYVVFDPLILLRAQYVTIGNFEE